MHVTSIGVSPSMLDVQVSSSKDRCTGTVGGNATVET